MIFIVLKMNIKINFLQPKIKYFSSFVDFLTFALMDFLYLSLLDIYHSVKGIFHLFTDGFSYICLQVDIFRLFF